ncbi:spermatogenesis-associated serine-rich protein 2 [Catharus ustulatus]|uniref:spermatogenesis-associated serine-rich protein 2 n=1 Tax=Catharus ustulatus TaxID=91951 RepID=UPI00140D4186|nr:spermatogenesis-associated serine-rich protein 2 [Catharus ustulatus]
MSRKQHKDPSGFVFDARSGAVRAQGGCSESIRDKVQAVRAVVPNRSNTEIVLVLQHFDNAVDRTVQAFMEGNASEVLKEWTVTGKKKPKKKKSKPRPQPGPGPAPSAPEPWPGPALNGFHGNGADTMETLSDGGDSALGNGIPNFPQKSQIPNPNRSSPGSPGGKKSGCSLEKSLKDLQRCSVALARFRALLRDEVENSLRRARAAFGEIQSCLMDREVALLAEMDKVKAEAMELLSLRQRRAEALRLLTEAAPGMSEEQLLELRADIKHFVSERKFDEELGRAGRFGCDLEALRGSIGNFGHGE